MTMSLPTGILQLLAAAIRIVAGRFPPTIGEFEENIDTQSLSQSPPLTQSQSFHPTQTQSPCPPSTGPSVGGEDYSGARV